MTRACDDGAAVAATDSTGVAVIGGGVVGLTIALRLAQAGREVVLVEPGEPGGGASYGNAGTIADYAVMPVGTPDVLRDLPSLLFDRDSPLAIRRAAIPSLAPWLLRFLRQSLPGPARRNAVALAALLADAAPLWRDLAAEIGGSDLMHARGALYIYDTPRALQDAARGMAERRALGVRVEMLDPDALATLEPSLPAAAGAAYFPDALFLTDPGRMVGLVALQVARLGVGRIAARATALDQDSTGVTITGPGLRLRAAHAVIAAGAHSRPLARAAGDAVPLDTERGYHLEWDMEHPRLSRPVCPVARGFYLCPMAGRLRVVGTVELGGLDAPPSPHRLAALERGARGLFPDLGAPARSWMGFRPSMPDSLPVIGPSRRGPRVLHAYGHGHIGLTLAPATARFITGLISGESPPAELLPCLPARFGF